MACVIRDKSGNYHVRFDYGGREFKRSLKTKDEALADAGVARVRDTVMALHRGYLVMPEGAEPGAFIVSGGKRTGKAKAERTNPTEIPTVKAVFALYRETLTADSKAASSRMTEEVHIGHIEDHFGEETDFASILATTAVQGYVDARTRKGRATQTIKKELATLALVANWAKRCRVAPRRGRA